MERKKSKSSFHSKCKTSHGECSQNKQVKKKKSSLLNVLNPERECACEAIANAVQSLHMNLGLTEQRAAVNELKSESTEQLEQSESKETPEPSDPPKKK